MRRASGIFQAGFWLGGFFNLHVAELFGVKDLATIQALDKFTVFVPGNDAYPGVLADGCHRSWYRWNKVLFGQIVPAFGSIWNHYLRILFTPEPGAAPARAIAG
jgi:hypothetical protein